MGTLVWGLLGQGLLTGRVRRDHNDLSRAGVFRHLTDERRLDVVERLVSLAGEAGLPMTHLAMAFTIAHPSVTCALLGARTEAHLDDLLAGGLDVTLSDDVLDRIDQIVPPTSRLPSRTRACGAGPSPHAPRPELPGASSATVEAPPAAPDGASTITVQRRSRRTG
jgi:hypothetical protein